MHCLWRMWTSMTKWRNHTYILSTSKSGGSGCISLERIPPPQMHLLFTNNSVPNLGLPISHTNSVKWPSFCVPLVRRWIHRIVLSVLEGSSVIQCTLNWDASVCFVESRFVSTTVGARTHGAVWGSVCLKCCMMFDYNVFLLLKFQLTSMEDLL